MEKRNNDLKNPHFFPNVELYYTELDDNFTYRALEEANSFITKEISKLKAQLMQNEKDISDTKKKIREVNFN